ncbi:peptidase inhibitor family I36 protein [Nocardioides zeae]
MGRRLKRLAGVVVATLVLGFVATDTGAAAPADRAPATGAEETAAAALVDELARDPDGQVVGNRVYRPDGTVFVAVDAGVRSLDQCASGRFCMWSQTYYQGSFYSAAMTGTEYPSRGPSARCGTTARPRLGSTPTPGPPPFATLRANGRRR